MKRLILFVAGLSVSVSALAAGAVQQRGKPSDASKTFSLDLSQNGSTASDAGASAQASPPVVPALDGASAAAPPATDAPPPDPAGAAVSPPASAVSTSGATAVDPPAATGTTPPPALRGVFTLDTPIEVLIANPAAKAVLDRDLPGMSDDSNLDKFKQLSLRGFQPLTGGQLTDAMLAKVAGDLSAIATGEATLTLPKGEGTSKRDKDISR